MATTVPEDLLGLLTDVSASWLTVPPRERVPLPLFVWLTIDGLGTRKLHTPGSGGVAILDEPAVPGYELGENGRVDVESGTPEVLAAWVGRRIERVSRLWQEPPGEEVGFVLHFLEGSVAIANLADDLIIQSWPDQSWADRDVSLMSDA